AFLLFQYGAAGVIGILLFSGPMLGAVLRWNKPMMFLFLGAIIGSVPPLYRRVKVAKIRRTNILVGVVGALVAISTRFMPEGLFELSGRFDIKGILILFIAGIVLAVAFVLPGISASYMLLMLGIYNTTLIAIKQVDLLFLTTLATGVILGTLLTAGILEREMKTHPQFTYMLIIGFMLGSLVEVFPGVPFGMEILACILAFSFGFVSVYMIGRKGNKKKTINETDLCLEASEINSLE
ncbi:DUF368 domain-containing protein, partial [bacterium]|nr:DUF368 domain-containing protein [bacterium]